MQHWHHPFIPTASAAARNNTSSTGAGGIFPSSPSDWCHPTNIAQYMGVPALFQGHVFLPQPAYFQMPLIGGGAVGNASTAYDSLMQQAAYHQHPSLAPTPAADYFIEPLAKSHDGGAKVDDRGGDKRKAASQMNNSLMNIYPDETYQPKRPTIDVGNACHYHHYLPQQSSVDHHHLIDNSTSASNLFFNGTTVPATLKLPLISSSDDDQHNINNIISSSDIPSAVVPTFNPYAVASSIIEPPIGRIIVAKSPDGTASIVPSSTGRRSDKINNNDVVVENRNNNNNGIVLVTSTSNHHDRAPIVSTLAPLPMLLQAPDISTTTTSIIQESNVDPLPPPANKSIVIKKRKQRIPQKRIGSAKCVVVESTSPTSTTMLTKDDDDVQQNIVESSSNRAGDDEYKMPKLERQITHDELQDDEPPPKLNKVVEPPIAVQEESAVEVVKQEEEEEMEVSAEPIDDDKQRRQRRQHASCRNSCASGGARRRRVPKIVSNWKPIGTGVKRYVYLNNDTKPVKRVCYGSIRHKREPETIRVKDCVVIKSTDNSLEGHVGKVTRLFVDPDSNLLMASIFWYYRSDQLEVDLCALAPRIGRRELLASRHIDVISVDSVEDVAFVLTYHEFCRYVAENVLDVTRPVWPNDGATLWSRGDDDYERRDRQPREDTPGELVFYCRRVYDFKAKRVLPFKNRQYRRLMPHQQRRAGGNVTASALS